MDEPRGRRPPPVVCFPAPRTLLTFGAVLLLVLAAGCTRPAPVQNTPPVSLPEINHSVTRAELVFFHTVPGCDSCERVGLYANETVTSFFAPELAEHRLVYRDVNLNLPENRELAERYGAPFDQSLWIGVYDERGFQVTEILDIWYYVYNREEFMTYLRGVLERKLAGMP